MSTGLRRLGRVCALGLVLGNAGTAWAQEQQDATVHVTLRSASGEVADGRVSLQSMDGDEVASCTTKLGKCTMERVRGGRYRATVHPKQGPAPKAREVMIPPSGEVGLVLSTGS